MSLKVTSWMTYDFPKSLIDYTLILQKLIHAYLVKPLPAGCRLTAIFDVSYTVQIYDHSLTDMGLISLATLALLWVSFFNCAPLK